MARTDLRHPPRETHSIRPTTVLQGEALRIPALWAPILFLGLSLLGCGVQTEMTTPEKKAEIDRMYAEYEAEFPEVLGIEATDLIERTSTEAAENLTLIDVRPIEERAVSIIPGAISLEDFERDPRAYDGSTLVTYCTVGYRSGLVAAELQERGFEVLNLKGSLLSWAHAGGELENAEGPTQQLHVYGRRWDLAPEGYETRW